MPQDDFKIEGVVKRPTFATAAFKCLSGQNTGRIEKAKTRTRRTFANREYS